VFQGFVFSDQTSFLSDAEFAAALGLLDCARDAVRRRGEAIQRDPERAAIWMPDEGWHPDSQPSFELDGSTKNAQTSYELLDQGDREIIAKMRLYGHSFTGYQLATLELAGKRPWLSRKLPENWDDVLRFLVGPPDRAVFDYVAVAGALPEELRASPPRKFGEIGWLIDGAIVNDDSYAYLERLCLMHENGLIDHLRERRAENGILRIVEIGGGFGGLAYQLMKLFGECVRYTIIDIPESLAFSSIYCSTLFPKLDNRFEQVGPVALPEAPGFSFVPNSIHHQLADADLPADLVVNTLSLSEMSDAQIHDYCKAASRIIGETGIFFEQNHQTGHRGPGDIPPLYLKNLKKCESRLLTDSFPARRGDANLWVNANYGANYGASYGANHGE
jgi:putative sugar O-methyltransferase|tara:strand:- start:852 stop:2018 length:1167 start_codon:yes stop_codon:yes gene_type:complete